MPNIPSLRVHKSGFRSKTSSSDQNTMMDETLFNLTNLYNLVNEQERLLEDVKDIMGVENKYQSIQIQSLKAQLSNIESLMNQIKSGNGRYSTRIYTDAMVTESTTPEQERADIDTYHGLVTLPTNGQAQSKIYLYDEVAKEVVLPSTMKVDILPKANNINVIDNDMTNAFNGENSDIWRRKYLFAADDAVESVTTELTITLPDNIISSRDVNTISIHPFPLSSVDIEKIEYKMDGGWHLIPGWPKDGSDRPITLKDAANVKFCFEPLAMAQVRITLTQTKYIIENQQKTFYVGAQEIGVSYTDYQSSVGRFTASTTLQTKSRGKLITGIRPVFRNAEALSDKSDEKRNVFSYGVYGITADGTLQYTRDTLPIMVDTPDILIRGNLYMDAKTGNTPALECIEVTYEELV